MAIPLGRWRSPGGIRNRTVWELARKAALDRIEPSVMAQAQQVFGPELPPIRPSAVGGLDARAQRRRPFNLGRPQLTHAAPTPTPTPTRLGPLTMQQPGPMNAPATIAPSGAGGSFPFQGGRNLLELAGAAAGFIGGLPVPGGPITVTPGFRGGRPSASISMPRTQTVADVHAFEEQIAEHVTEPAGRFAGRALVEGVAQKLNVPRGAPGRERAVEIGGDVGAFVAGEGIRVSNIIPIPVIDPALARLIGVTVKMGKAVTPGVLRTLSRNADTIAKAGGEFATQARKFVDDAAKLLQSERGAVPLGPKGPGADFPRAAGRDVVDIPVNQIDVRSDLFQARDVSVEGAGVGAKRVREMIENFDPARLDPINVVRDPVNEGRFIVTAGHHRLATIRGKFGVDATIPAVVREGDIRDAATLSRLRLEAVASNFSTAELNVREQVRSVGVLAEGGLGTDDIARQLRLKPAQVEALADINRLGPQVLDRIVTEPALTPIASEIGRAVRLHGIDAEQAGALFARFSQVDAQGRTVTRASLRSTLTKFAPKLEGVTLPGFDSALGGADTRSGILELIADVGRSRAQLESERGALRAAIKATQRLGESSGLKSEADALVRFGEKAVEQVETRIKALEKDLTQQLRREAATPTGITPARAAPEARPTGAAEETPLFGAETPPTERPTGAVTFGEERIAPQFGSQQPEFRGEQAGIAPRMFDDAETGFRGQGRLEDVAEPPPPAPPPSPPTAGGVPPSATPPPPRGAFERGPRPRVEGQPALPGELAPEGVAGAPPGPGQRPRVEGQRPLPGQLAPEGVTGEPIPAGGPVSQADLDPLAALRRDLEATYVSDPELGAAPTVFHRDVIGERLLRDNLPTSADVKNWSASTPPEVRAARAEEILDVRGGVEDFDVVVAREADRYRQNFVTKFDDWWQPLRGRDRAKQIQVRNAFLDADVYTARQTARQRIALQLWTADHREVLGLTTTNLDPLTRKALGQGQRGRARKVQPRAEAQIHRDAVQRLDDIIEHPGDYIISPEQQRALDDFEALMTDNLRAVQRHGGDVNFLENYAPHVITKTPRGMTTEAAIAQLSTRFPVTHPWFTKARTVPDIRQLIELGYGVADPLAAAELRLVAGIQTISNVQIIKRLRSLGISSAEQVPAALAANLRAATKLQQTARKTALRTGTTADRAAAHKADVALDKATREMRLAARKIQEQRPKIFGRDVAPELATEMNKFLGAEDQNYVDDALRVMRTTLVGSDVGSAYLQNATTFWRNPSAWATGVGVGLRAVASTPYDYLLRNTDSLLLHAEYGVLVFPEEFILARGGRIPQLIGELPIIKESQTFLEWNILITQNEVAKGVLKHATSEKEMFDLAVVLRNRSGAAFTPGMTASQARWMRKLLFARSFTTAITSAVLDPVIRTGVARRESMKGMGAIFGGAASLVVAGSMIKNGTPGNFTDPDKPGFWGVPVPGGHVFPLGPFQPLMVAMTRTARAASDIARGRKPSDRDVKAWPRFITNKASIAVRWATRAAEALGLPLENLVGPSFGRPEIIREGESALSALKREVLNIAPIGIRQAIEGVRGGNFPTGVLEIAGVRTTPQSTFAKFREAFREEFGRDYDGKEGDRTIAMTKPHLRELLEKSQRESLRRGQPFAVERQEREDAIAGLAQDLSPFAEGIRAGNTDAGAQFLRAYSSFKTQRSGVFQRDFFGEEFPERETEVGQALDQLGEMNPNAAPYLDAAPEGGSFQVDWDLWYADQERLFAIIEREHPGFTEDYKTRAFLPEEFADVERQAIAARGLRSQLREISQVNGLSAEQHQEVKDFLRTVGEARRSWLENHQISFDQVSLGAAIAEVGEYQGRSANFLLWAQALRAGVPDDERTGEYDRFILAHQTELRPFYPSLYRTTRILEQLSAAPVLEPAGVR